MTKGKTSVVEEKPIKKTQKTVNIKKPVNLTKAAKESVKEPVKESIKVVSKELVEKETDEKSKFKKQIELLYKELDDYKTKNKVMMSCLKKLESSYDSDMKKIEKMKRKRSGNHKPTGFENPYNIPNKFADFLNVEHGCKMTGPEITKKMWEVLREKGLVSDKDGRVFKVTKEVMDVFKLPKEALKVTKMDIDNGFNMLNLQKYIKVALEN
jgi:hypothetical protein